MSEDDPTLFTDMKRFYMFVFPHALSGLLIAILFGAFFFPNTSKTVIIQTITTSAIGFFIINCYYLSRLILYLVNWGISRDYTGERT